MYEASYAFTRQVPGRTFDQFVARVREALAAEGFGVLSEIDVQATLRKKLNVERRPYLILGACNPPLAHQALEAEPSIGVLLPCNVDVFEGDDGQIYVQAVNARRVFELVGKPGVQAIADDVAARLERVLDAVQPGEAPAGA